MPDYQQGKIYKLYNTECDKYYIGSTTRTLKRRFNGHKKKPTFSSKLMFNYNSLPKIELIEIYPCETKLELRTREQYHMDINKVNIVNHQRALMTRDDRNRYMCEFRTKPHMKDILKERQIKHNELYKVKVVCPNCNNSLSKSSMWYHKKICI